MISSLQCVQVQQVMDGSRMKVIRNILMTVLVLTLSVSARAQLKLNPFAKDSTLLSFTTKHIEAETMSENAPPVTFTYGFKNTGIRKVKIERLVTSCSCAYAYCDRNVVGPGEEAQISVRFNPKGHPGKFDRKIFVYTKGENDPTAVLTLSVNVENRMDVPEQYSITMGDIKLKSRVVKFRKGEPATESLSFINVSGRSLNFDCDRALLPSCLKFYAEPVRPMKEGVIKITYDPSKGMERDEMVILLQGLGGTPSSSSIKVILE